jgi:hypothetical protein
VCNLAAASTGCASNTEYDVPAGVTEHVAGVWHTESGSTFTITVESATCGR